MNQKTQLAEGQNHRFLGQRWEFLLPLAIPAVLVIIGWFVNDCNSSRRERASKQRDLTTQYLIDAYRKIETVCNRTTPSGDSTDMKRGVETAIADIQLFGSAKQIELAKRVVKEIEKNSRSDPRYLLIELRNDLRKELNLEAASSDSSDIMHFRVYEMFPQSRSSVAEKHRK